MKAANEPSVSTHKWLNQIEGMKWQMGSGMAMKHEHHHHRILINRTRANKRMRPPPGASCDGRRRRSQFRGNYGVSLLPPFNRC